MNEQNNAVFGALGDLGSTDVSFPIAAPGLYKVNWTEYEIKDNKKGTGKNLVMKLITTGPITTNKGEPRDSFSFTNIVSLEKTDKYDPNKNLSQIMDAVKGNHNGLFDPDSLLNQELTIRVKVENNEEFGDQNRVQFVKKETPKAA